MCVYLDEVPSRGLGEEGGAELGKGQEASVLLRRGLRIRSCSGDGGKWQHVRMDGAEITAVQIVEGGACHYTNSSQLSSIFGLILQHRRVHLKRPGSPFQAVDDGITRIPDAMNHARAEICLRRAVSNLNAKEMYKKNLPPTPPPPPPSLQMRC